MAIVETNVVPLLANAKKGEGGREWSIEDAYGLEWDTCSEDSLPHVSWNPVDRRARIGLCVDLLLSDLYVLPQLFRQTKYPPQLQL